MQRIRKRCVALLALLLLPLLGACGAQGAGDEMPPILYLGWDDAGHTQLFRTAVDGAPLQLTAQAQDVFDFAVAPDGSQIAYSLLQDDGASAIWVMDANGRSAREVLRCPQAQCTHLVWAPDGRRLAYERREADAPGVPRLWWLDTHSGATLTLLEDATAVSSGVQFSPDGAWISYVGSPDEGVRAYNLEDGRYLQLAAEMGTPAIWSPDGRSLLVRNQDVYVVHGSDDDNHLEHSHDYALSVYLYRTDLSGAGRRQISAPGEVDDGNPAWSSDGEWIAFGRKKPRTATGRQLWIMRADGSEARALTDDLSVHHGPPAWSPDGRYLLFQRYALTEPDAQPQVWLLDITSETMQTIITPGMQPRWLPQT